MNAPILRLFVVFLILFGALVGFTSYNAVINADEYRDNPLNARPLLEQQRIRRGLIRDAEGNLLARSTRDSAGLWSRTYTPEARQFSHALGYSFVGRGRAGVEESRNDDLIGERSELTSILDQLRGKRQEGDNVFLTLDARAQEVARNALNGRKGSVVAIEPSTGRVKVMVSVPGFDPNDIRSEDKFKALNRDEANAPLVNRATQATYPPGSTMKVVTAAAALDTGKYTPNSVVNGDSGQDISAVPLANFGGKDWGDITLTTALTNSVNTVWAKVAEDLGAKTYNRYMERFGFGKDPDLDYPDRQMNPSGVYSSKGRLLRPSSSDVDIGRVAIGQERLQVTPLQMAEVAATVANDGVLMRPRLTEKIVDRDGRTVEDYDEERVGRVMKSGTARALGKMMEQVVREGTGTASALSGIAVAGKTGTAEIIPDRDINQPWFIGFAPAGNAKIAIAVTIERSQGGQGGTEAAPVAKQVLQELTR